MINLLHVNSAKNQCHNKFIINHEKYIAYEIDQWLMSGCLRSQKMWSLIKINEIYFSCVTLQVDIMERY